MPKYDVTRIENRAGGYSEHLGEINAPTLESAQDRASVEYECPESCRLVVSECESETTTAKHTPGPWKLRGHRDDQSGRTISTISTAGGAELLTFPQHVCGRTFPELYANARLIAAAPELLEALERLAEYWQNGSPVCAGSEVAKDAIAAIAKARGE
jgi:hypothetical protein